MTDTLIDTHDSTGVFESCYGDSVNICVRYSERTGAPRYSKDLISFEMDDTQKERMYLRVLTFYASTNMHPKLIMEVPWIYAYRTMNE